MRLRLKNKNYLLKTISLFVAVFIFDTSIAYSADEDDFYLEVLGGGSLNRSGRLFAGARVGYCPQDEIGVGIVFEQHSSRDSKSLYSSLSRGGLEFRWFQEPFEFAGVLSMAQKNFKDGASSFEILPSVSTVYLIAFAPSLSAMIDFSFLFMEQGRRVDMFAGVGVRALF